MPKTSTWIAALPAAHEVGQALGLTVRRRTMGPCPACDAKARSGRDERLPLGLTSNQKGWHCHACGQKGSVVGLVSLHLFKVQIEKGDPRWPEIQAWCSEHGLFNGAPGKVVALPPPSRPPPHEVAALWDASLPIRDAAAEVAPSASTRAALAFLAQRDFQPGDLPADLVRLLPDPRKHRYPCWWPRSWAAAWRLVVCAYTPQGTAASLHARSVIPDEGGPKTRWPKDYEARGLLFANSQGVQLLRGERPEIQAVLIVEGLTDLLAAARLCLPIAVLGGASGCWVALEAVRFPEHVPIIVGTDLDPTGDKYAMEIARFVRPRSAHRMRLSEVGRQGADLGDVLRGPEARNLLIRLIEDAEGQPPVPVIDEDGPHSSVVGHLAASDKGVVKPCFSNVYQIFLHDPRWSDLRLNVLGDIVERAGKDVGHEAVLTARAAAWLAQHYEIYAGALMVKEALWAVAQERAYNPVVDYLRRLRWDHEPRIHRMLGEVLGCPESETHQIYLRRFLISAVARALDPGCKVDTALILVGKQGAKKSGFFKALFGGDWFGDSPIPIGDKDAAIQLRAVWGYEAAEMEDLSKRTAEAVKQFLSTSADLYRGLWERNARIRKRHAVLCGTTNREQFLTDDTGHRRFWPLQVPDESVIRVDLAAAWRDQVWAEAVVAFTAKERWWFEREEEQARQVEVEQFAESDPWEDLFQAWLVSQMHPFTLSDVLVGALKLDPWQQDSRTVRRAGKVLRSLGWENQVEWSGGRAVRRWRRIKTE